MILDIRFSASFFVLLGKSNLTRGIKSIIENLKWKKE